jgi:Putative DNA-binding domain
VNSPPESPSLAELQARFASALRAGGARSGADAAAFAACIVDDGLAPTARVQVYRNNVRAMFAGALERTYPVLRQRVGEGFFAKLAAEYRSDHPSSNGDLHWIGRRFPDWIGTRMAGTDYAWLADLARLEWACEEVLVSAWLPPAPADSLARLQPEQLAGARLALQPGLRTVSSSFPVWSVWQANQPGSSGGTVASSLGAEHVAVAQEPTGLVLHSLPSDRHRFVEQLAAGHTLEDALEASAQPIERLGEALAWLFGAGLVIEVIPAGNSNASGEPT